MSHEQQNEEKRHLIQKEVRLKEDDVRIVKAFEIKVELGNAQQVKLGWTTSA